MPAMVSVAAVLLASAQVPPLSASVTVTVEPEPAPVAEQCAKAADSPMAGNAGATKPDWKLTVIVEVADSAPTAVGVNPTVQVAVAPAVCGAPANDTFVTIPAVITTGEAGEAFAASDVVLTVNVV